MLEQIHNLKELWLDNNSLQSIPGVRTLTALTVTENSTGNIEMSLPLTYVLLLCLSFDSAFIFSTPRRPLQSIGKLRQLRYLDLAKNRIETLDTDISGCEALEDLLLSSNMLQHLPDTIGKQHNNRRGLMMKMMKIFRDGSGLVSFTKGSGRFVELPSSPLFSK